MSRRMRWWWWVAGGAGLLSAILLVLQPHRPVSRVVHGKDVSLLINDFLSADEAVRARARQDLVTLGTNAIPVLLEMAEQRDPWKRRIFDWLGPKLRAPQKEWLRARWRPHEAMVARDRAAAALKALASTDALLPAWGQLLRHPDRDLANMAWIELREAGPAAIEYWRAGARDHDAHVRRIALSGLAGLGSAAAPALPELRAALEDSNADMRLCAVLVLGQLGAAGWPDLVAMGLRKGDPVRANAILQLVWSPSATRSNAAHVLAWVNDPDIAVRNAAVPGLRWIRPWTPAVEAALVSACRAKEPRLRAAALEVISGAREPSPRLRAVVEVCLRDEVEPVRAAATNALKGLDRFPLDTR